MAVLKERSQRIANSEIIDVETYNSVREMPKENN